MTPEQIAIHDEVTREFAQRYPRTVDSLDAHEPQTDGEWIAYWDERAANGMCQATREQAAGFAAFWRRLKA